MNKDIFNNLNQNSQDVEARMAGRQKLEEITKETNVWDYPRWIQVCILSAAFKSYVPAPYRPEKIHLGRLNLHARDLSQKSEQEGGIEISRTFFTDIQQKKLLAGRTVQGDPTSVRYDWRKEDGKANVQFRTIGMHVHPRRFLDKGINPFSPKDFEGLMTIEETLADLIVMGDHMVMALKTSVTPRKLTKELVQDLTQGIAGEYQSVINTWYDMKKAIRANKEISTALGLMFYLGKIGESMQRIPLTQ